MLAKNWLQTEPISRICYFDKIVGGLLKSRLITGDLHLR